MKIKNFYLLFAAILLTTVGVVAQQQEHEPSAARLKQHVSYLASDALEGRRTGTAGADQAARYIADEFARLGLTSANSTAKYLQPFPYVAGVELGKANEFKFTRAAGGEGQTLRVGEDWMPLGFSSNAKIAARLVFAGYGITAAEQNYDDYAGLNVKDSVAVALQGTPDGDNPHGQFARYEGIRWKAIAARNAGAKALVVVARESDFKEEKLARLTYDNTGGEAGLPVVVISRRSIDSILGSPTLTTWEKIAKEKSQATTQSPSIQLNITTNVVRKEVPAHNVIGVLEGSHPILKNENIVIGAHYDHLGRGGDGSLDPTSSDIHHGADDNASGTAGLLELARIFSAQRPRLQRTIVFIAFGGEEEGLIGSSYYVNHPVTPITNTVAMINMDMIGRMKDRKLVIAGVGTAQEWREIIKRANTDQAMTVTANAGPAPARGVPVVVSANGRPIMTVDPNGAFELTLSEDGYGPSDHSQFYGKQVPVLFFWTGTHGDYHKPSDTFDKINYDDEARILNLVARIVRHVDGSEKRLSFTTAKADPPRGGVFRVYLGTIPNYADSTNGLLIDGVREGSPAAKAGLKPGDRIVKIGSREIKNVYDYTYALGEMKAGQEYVIEIVRGEQKLSLKVIPEARK